MNAIDAKIRNQRFGNYYGPVFLLAIFKDRRRQSSNSDAGAV